MTNNFYVFITYQMNYILKKRGSLQYCRHEDEDAATASFINNLLDIEAAGFFLRIGKIH